MAMSAYYLKGIAPPHVQLIADLRRLRAVLLMVFLTMVLVYVFPGMVDVAARALYSTGR